jgi:uncharacterized protein YndB with AHSA1/START domain
MPTLTKNGKLAYTYELYIAAPAAKVWQGMFERDVPLPHMYGTRLRGALTKGTAYAYLGEGDYQVVDGKVLAVEPGSRILMTWAAHWDEAATADRPSRVAFELTPIDASTTRLSLVHDDFDGKTATYEGSVSSWPRMLSSLKSLLETGKPIAVA